MSWKNANTKKYNIGGFTSSSNNKTGQARVVTGELLDIIKSVKKMETAITEDFIEEVDNLPDGGPGHDNPFDDEG